MLLVRYLFRVLGKHRVRVLIGKGFQKRLMFELNPEALKEFPRRSRPGREELMEGPDVRVSPVGSHIIKNKKNANQS